MKASEKKIALDVIEKVRGILADMPDPQVHSLEIAHYEPIRTDTYRITLLLANGSELQLYLSDKKSE